MQKMSLQELMNKKNRLVIGLMSGTSADGTDAALVNIAGSGIETCVQMLDYISIPFEKNLRAAILELAGGKAVTAGELCRMNRLLGEIYLQACLTLCQKAQIDPSQIDLVGCHGQTIWHQPEAEFYFGKSITSTLQIGDVSPICEKMGTICVSDFRVRDMAAGGQGAPLVPYTEYILYRDPKKNVALQNIGGIGNITLIPAGCGPQEMIAFDTGPGNMLIDAAVSIYSDGQQLYDQGGEIASSCQIGDKLLEWLMEEPYISISPPKTTGRERYDQNFVEKVMKKAKECGNSVGEVVATLTAYTAQTIIYSIQKYMPVKPDRLIIGGGGSYNRTLLKHIRAGLPEVEVLTNEEIGYNGDAKEAVAFAILANETINGVCSNIPAVTGASHPVVLGKISQ